MGALFKEAWSDCKAPKNLGYCANGYTVTHLGQVGGANDCGIFTPCFGYKCSKQFVEECEWTYKYSPATCPSGCWHPLHKKLTERPFRTRYTEVTKIP